MLCHERFLWHHITIDTVSVNDLGNDVGVPQTRPVAPLIPGSEDELARDYNDIH